MSIRSCSSSSSCWLARVGERVLVLALVHAVDRALDRVERRHHRRDLGAEQRAQVVERRGIERVGHRHHDALALATDRQQAVLTREVDRRALDQIDRHLLGLDVGDEGRPASSASARAMATSSATWVANSTSVSLAPRSSAMRSASSMRSWRNDPAPHQDLADEALFHVRVLPGCPVPRAPGWKAEAAAGRPGPAHRWACFLSWGCRGTLAAARWAASWRTESG